MWKENTGDIIHIIQHRYEDILEKQQGDELRLLLNMYAAGRVRYLWKDSKSQRLLETTGELGAGLINDLRKRLD